MLALQEEEEQEFYMLWPANKVDRNVMIVYNQSCRYAVIQKHLRHCTSHSHVLTDLMACNLVFRI